MGASLYVKLDVNYFDDDKIMSVSSEAELLYVRSLCFAKRVLSDGVIGNRQIHRIASDIPSDELDPKAVPAMTQELVDAGLWVEVDGGWKVAAWEKHNELADEIEAKKTGGELGNHKRWHVGKKGKPSEACSLCRSESLIAPESEDRSDPGIAGTSDSESTETETETETEPEPSGVGDATPSKSRPRDETFEALVEVCGLTLDELTKTERGRCNKAAKELREVGATPDGVRARAQVYRQRWPTADMTPQALTANYSLLGTPSPAARNGHHDTSREVGPEGSGPDGHGKKGVM